MSTQEEQEEKGLVLITPPSKGFVENAIDPKNKIESFVEESKSLVLEDLQDKKSYELIKAKHIEGKKFVSALKARTSMYKKEIDAVKNLVVGVSLKMQEPLDLVVVKLGDERKKFEDEKERIKNAEKLRLQGRKDELFENGFIFNGSHYALDGADGIAEHLVTEMEDDDFANVISENMKQNEAYLKDLKAKQDQEKAKDDELAELKRKLAEETAERERISKVLAEKESPENKPSDSSLAEKESPENKPSDSSLDAEAFNESNESSPVDEKQGSSPELKQGASSEDAAGKAFAEAPVSSNYNVYQCAKTLFFINKALDKTTAQWDEKTKEISIGLVENYLEGRNTFEGDPNGHVYIALINSFK